MKYIFLLLFMSQCAAPNKIQEENIRLYEIADSLYNEGYRDFMCMYVHCGETASSEKEVCVSCSKNCKDIGIGDYRCDSLIYHK